jgi:hypothetical protein
MSAPTLTLHQALAARGYAAESRPGLPDGMKAITRRGRVLAHLRAGDAWDWLHRRDRKLEALRRGL